MSKQPKDLEAFERKIRPIYDALDSRNWKGALKLCQQALQKYPDNELIKVLKAIGLQRSGRRDEANQLVDEVAAGTPTDEQVLRLGAMVLRAAGRRSAITAMYEAAAAAAATQGGELALLLLHEVFGAHVRESNFVKQQQVALRLSKAVAGTAAQSLGISGERYGWWVVLSLLLQARAVLRVRVSGRAAAAGQVPGVAMDPEKMLALAEGMMARQAAKDGRLEGYEALMVYVDVLLAQGKVLQALDLVSGSLGTAALRLPSERLQLRAVLCGLAGNLEAGAAALREGLALNPDDWGAILLLLDFLLPGSSGGTSVAAGGRPTSDNGVSATAAAPAAFTPRHPLVLISGGLAEQLPPRGAAVLPDRCDSEEAFKQAEAVLQELVSLALTAASTGCGQSPGDKAVAAKAMTMRGPDLALVDLAMRRHRHAASETTEAAVVDAILSYFRKYSALVSCAVDLRTYAAQLGPAAAETLAAALEAEMEAGGGDAGGGGVGSSGGLSVLRRRVCAAQIRDDLGLPRLASCEAGVALARELLKLYSTAQPMQEGLDERERGAADELPVMAASALMTSAALASSDAEAVPYILAAYAALSDAVRQRPYGAAMRISLSALAAFLAAPSLSAGHLHKLDVKHIQLDTLGSHLLLPPLLAWPAGSVTGTGGAGSAAVDLASGGGQQGHQLLLSRALRDTRALFDDHDRDAGETAFTAYNHGMYTKVFEFTAFRERLANAHTLAVVRAEAAVTDCLRGTSASSSSSGGGGAGGGGGSGVPAVAPSSGDFSGWEAMRAAAVAAAAALPTHELPTADSLRYNLDLSTRPTWLPPCAASPSLCCVEWWQARARGEVCGQGYGRRWWSATSAAEGASPAADDWRAAQAAAVVHRWLLPHCVAGALGAAGTEVLPLKDAVARLRALLERSGAAVEEKAPSGLPSPHSLRSLDVSLYATALAVQECLGGSSPACVQTAATSATLNEADVEAACTALAGLTAQVHSAAETAAASVGAAAASAGGWGGMLPGSDLALIAHLQRETMAVLTACIQSWQAALKALRKRKAKSGAALEAAAQRLTDGVTAAAEQLAAAARACGDAVAAASTALGDQVTVAGQAIRFMQTQGHAPQALSETAAAALAALSGEQRTTMASLVRQAMALAAALS